MTRAHGKHNSRPAVIDPDSPEGQYQGQSDLMQGYPSPIPGGKVHIVNPETMRHPVPIADSDPGIVDLNAHGVQPGTHTSRERAEGMRGPNALKFIRPETAPARRFAEPVPVFIVTQPNKPKTLITSSPRKITLQASTGEPVRVAGQDRTRLSISLLNESTASNIRFAQKPSDLNNGNGALLPWPANTYLKMVTQDELWAISADSGTPVLSVVMEFEQPW